MNQGIWGKPWHRYKFNEPPYAITKYIGEFHATWSNIGFILVGIYYLPHPIAISCLLAGIFSAISHITLWKNTLFLDYFGVILSIMIMLYYHKYVMYVLQNSMYSQISLLCIVLIALIDLGSRYTIGMGDKYLPIYPHTL